MALIGGFMHNVYKCFTERLACNCQYRINVCISQSYIEKTQRLFNRTVDLNLNGNMPNHTTAVLSLLHPKPAWSSLVVPMHLKLGCPGYLFEIFLLLLLFKKKKKIAFFFLIIFLFTIIYCVCICRSQRPTCGSQFSFHHVRSRDQTLVVRLPGKSFYPLNQLSGSCCYF